MSLSVNPLEPIQAIDEVLNLNSHKQYTVYNGGQEVSYVQFQAQAVNNSNITITCNPPDEKTIIDRRVYATFVYDLTFSGVAGVGNLLQLGTFDGPRAFPIAQSLSTIDCKLNGTSINTNLNQYFSALIRYNNFTEDQDLDLSVTPSMLDQFQEYANWQAEGSGRNPLALYGENPNQMTRGGFPQMEILTNTPTSATVRMTVTEPLFLSPFYYHGGEGLAGIRTCVITFTFGDLRRVWSHSVAGNNVTSVVANISSALLDFRYITPKILENIPRNLSYPYYEVLITQQGTGAIVNAGAQTSVAMNAINLEAIPKRLYICLRERDTDINFTTSDTFARIDRIQVNWANNQGKLSSASIPDMYQIAKRNGCNMNYAQWFKHCGSVLALDIGKDIGLSSLDAPGLLSNPQLSMNITFTNMGSRNINFSLYVFVVYEGVLNINNGMVTKQISVLNTSDVVKAQEKPQMLLARHAKNYYGGAMKNMFGLSLFSDVKDVVKKVYNTAQKIAPDVAEAVAEGVEKLGPHAMRLLGLGMKKKRKGGAHTGGVYGGAVISRNDLMDM